MKNKTTSTYTKLKNDSMGHEIAKGKNTDEKARHTQEELTFNLTLLSSLPYPAMYVRRSDRIVLAANQLAIDFGAKVNEHCWKEFGKSKYIADEVEKSTADKKGQPNKKELTQCSFCRADECILEDACQRNPCVEAFDKVWDTYWIKVSDDVFLHYLIDITERIELEQSLLESEAFLKKTQEIAGLGTYSFDLQSGIWNSSFILDKLLGIETKENKTIEDWISIVDPSMRDELIDYYKQEVIEKKQNFDKEYKIIRPSNGEQRWLKGLGDLKLDDSGKPIKMIGTIHDITAIKHEQNIIIRNLKFTEVLLKSIPIPVFFLDASGKYSGCNEAFTKQLGLTMDQIKGKSVYDLWPSEHSLELYESDIKILSDDKIQKSETTILDKDGNKRDVILIKNTFHDELGDVAGVVETYIDITEQKKNELALRKSEQKYKLLARNVSDGIFTSYNNVIQYVNPLMRMIFGYDEHEMENGKLSDLIILGDRKDFDELVNFEKEKNQVRNKELYCIRKDKSIFLGELILHYVAQEATIYGVIHDITAKKQLHDKNIFNAILHTEENERSYFSKELHDGLGPLLSTIKIYLQWSMRPMTGRSRKKIITKAEEIVEESLRAVKEISSRLSPHLLTNYGLVAALQSFIDKIRGTNTIKVNFQTNLENRMDIKVEVGLYRVIIECLNNTMKYAEAKHIYIKIFSVDKKLQVQYMDDGKGFDIYKKLAEQKGLGLYNIQNRIKNMGGEIKMFSQRHEGVNYQITIPLTVE